MELRLKAKIQELADMTSGSLFRARDAKDALGAIIKLPENEEDRVQLRAAFNQLTAAEEALRVAKSRLTKIIE
jgi:bacterioferritin (cytochrome b1)